MELFFEERGTPDAGEKTKQKQNAGRDNTAGVFEKEDQRGHNKIRGLRQGEI